MKYGFLLVTTAALTAFGILYFDTYPRNTIRIPMPQEEPLPQPMPPPPVVIADPGPDTNPTGEPEPPKVEPPQPAPPRPQKARTGGAADADRLALMTPEEIERMTNEEMEKHDATIH